MKVAEWIRLADKLDIEELLSTRGVKVDDATIQRWDISLPIS